MKKINALLGTIIDTLESITITATTESRSSHGRTTATTTTRIHREKTAETTKTTTEEPWLVEPTSWKPAECRHSDGNKELWGKPRISLNGEISVPVRIVDGDVTVNEYTMSLTITVRDQIKACRREARLNIIRGLSPWIPLDVQRTRKLLKHHSGEKEWEQLRDMINELYSELNDIAAAAVHRNSDINAMKAALKSLESAVETMKAKVATK